MADIEIAAGGDQCLGTQPIDSAEGQEAEHCSNCNSYCWMYGEDCMPASLSCGHTICFKCAGSQWQSTGSEDLTVYCIPCSVHVAVTGYKSLPSSRTEQSLGTVQNTPTSSSRAEKCEAGMDTHGASEGEPVQNTPTQLQSSTVVIQQHSSSGKQNSSVGYTMDRVTSALSSPLVLDKIQSQDDAWRILQHDEGFIRDWIVANVPDHVIFKMVGAGNPDSSLDSGAFMAGNSSAVIVSSPPKTVDMAVTTPVTATAGSTSFPGVSTSQGENTSRVSFEQQFLQYLVSKAAPQDKLTSVVDVSKEHGLQGPLTTVDSAAQTSLDPVMEESGGMESSSALPRNKAAAMEIMMQGLKHVQPGRVGNKGDCSVAHISKNSSQLPSGLMGVSTEGEASQQAADFQSHPVQMASSQNVSAEAGQYDYGPSVLQAQPAAYSSYLPGASIAYQQNYNSHMFGTPGKNTARFPSFPAQRNMESDAFTGPHGPYSTYPYPYSQHSHYPWHKQYGQPYARMPQPGPFVRFPHYAPHRGGRFGRERSLAFPPPPFRMSSEPSWSSKACTMTLNPPPQTTLTALPQIRFVQVVRPKPDHLGMSEGPRMEEDAAALSGRVAEEIVDNEMPAVEGHEETEAEVALMKTRDMPHGTQVEDIYVVPQVWLTGGRDSAIVESSQDNDCSYPADSPLGSPSNPSLSVSESAVGEGAACPPASTLSPGKTRFHENYDTEQPNSAAISGFAGSKLKLMSREQAPETSGMLRASEATTTSLSESSQENATNDGSVYSGFKPVAVVTTVSAGKTTMATEPRAEMTAPEISNLPPPALIQSNTMTPAPIASNGGTFDQRQATETPVRDTAMMTDDILGEGSIGQVPSAPVKKVDRNLEQKYNTQALPLRQNIIEYSHQKVENSAQTLTSSGYTAGPCNKTVQDAIASEIARRAELDAQTSASGNEVQILEGQSSLPSAIMFSKQDAPGVPQSRKRLRRNLSSEFYNSDMGIGGSCYGNQRAETRASGRSGRWNPSKYSQYGSGFCSPQEAWFPHNYPYNYRPRPYYYHQTFANAQNASLNYRHPRQYPEVFSLPNSEKPGQFGMPVDEVAAPRQPGAMYSLLHRPAAYTPACPPFTARSQHSAPLSSQTFPSTSLSQPYPDVLSHPSSGRGDYSNTSSVNTRPKQQSRTTTGPKTDLGCGSDNDPPVGRGGHRQSQVWPADRGQSGGTGDGAYSSVRDWRSAPVRHRVPAQDLDTFHWIQKEVRELNKEMDSSMLTRLEGCLASLLEKNASHHHHHHSHPPAPASSSTSTTTTPLMAGSSSSSQAQRDARDRDHLWRCILTLGKVVVQYGWWVRPHHHWDGSSERWAEMAMLASSVFTHSLQRLTEVITFYLDHVGTTGDGGLSQDSFLPDRTAAHLLPSHDDGPRSVDHATSLNRGYSAEGQHQIGRAQSEYISMLPKGQSRVVRTAVGLSGLCSTAMESSKPCAASASVEQQYYSFNPLENQIRTVMVDSPESYIPNSSAFSQYEEGGSSALPKTEMYTGVFSRSEAAFAVEDHAILTRERETTPSVMYHYRVLDVTKQTPHSEHGRSTYIDGDVGASSQGRASVWTPEKANNPRTSGQFIEVQCSEAAEVEPLALSEDISCALDSAEAETPAMDTGSSLALDQTEMEVYYTVEGALINEIAPDAHILTTLQGPGNGEERVYAENIVYAVSQLADANSCSELCAEDTVSYILSTEVEETPQHPMPQEDIPLKTEPSDTTRDASPLPLNLPVGDQTTPTNTQVVPPGGNSLHQDSSDDKTIAEKTTDSSEEADVREAEPVFQSDQPDVNLYMVTVVPGEQADSGSEVMCSDQEVISDAAIMLSETVEVETDTSEEVNAVKEEPTSPQQGEDGCADQKENIDSTSCSGKRKHARTTHLKNKRSKQDVWCEKQPSKGTSSASGGKWNLRSSRGSV